MKIDTDWFWLTTETSLITRCLTQFAHYHRYPTELIVVGRDRGARVFDMIEYHCENGSYSHEKAVSFDFGLSTLGAPDNPAECERRLGRLVAEWVDKYRRPESWGERKMNVYNLNRGWNDNSASPAHALALVHYARLHGAIAMDPNVPSYLTERLGGLIVHSLVEWDQARQLMG